MQGELETSPFNDIEPYLEKRRRKMAEEPERKCDVDDILCQMAVLGHLRGLQSVLGEERYRVDFPELQGLDEKVRSQESTLRETLGRCGLPSLEGTEEIKEEENVE